MSLIRLTEVYFNEKNKECCNGILVNPERIMRIEPSSSGDKSKAESVIYFQLEDYIFVIESLAQLERLVAESLYPDGPQFSENVRRQREAMNGVP
jgi:hypothetical protein